MESMAAPSAMVLLWLRDAALIRMRVRPRELLGMVFSSGLLG
jgi:hypothetical protein